MSAPSHPPAPLPDGRTAAAPREDALPEAGPSLLMASAGQRLAGALGLVALLWLAVAWALALD